MAFISVPLSPTPRERAPLPKGRYKLRIVEGEKRVSQNGNEYLWLTFEVIEPIEYEGRRVWDRVMLDNGWMLSRLLLSSGYIYEERIEDEEGKPTVYYIRTDTGDAYDGFYIEDLIGREVLVELRQEEWNGSIRNRIARYITNWRDD